MNVAAAPRLPLPFALPTAPKLLPQNTATALQKVDEYEVLRETYPRMPASDRPRVISLLNYSIHRRPDGELVKSAVSGELTKTQSKSAGGVMLPAERIDSDTLSFSIIGDTGHGNRKQRAVAKALAEREKSGHFVMHVGDVVYPNGLTGPDDKRAEKLLIKPYQALSRMYLSLGNHDYAGRDGAGDPDALIAIASKKNDAFVMPARYYGFSYEMNGARADFFVLDTNVLMDDKTQLAWLDERLAESTATWKIVVGHHPIVSAGRRGDRPHLRATLLPLLEGRADLYCSGHEHYQEVRKMAGGLLTVTSGAGGDTDPYPSETDARFGESKLGWSRFSLTRDTLSLEVMHPEGDIAHRETVTKKA